MRKLYAIILMVFLSFSCGMVPAYAAETANQEGWITMPSQENVALDKVWTVKFSSIVSNDLIAGIVIEKEASSIPVTITLTDQNEAKVKAVSPYVSNSKYAVKVSLTNGKKYVMNFTTTSSEQTPAFTGATVTRSADGTQLAFSWTNSASLGQVSVLSSTEADSVASGKVVATVEGAITATSGSVTITDPCPNSRSYFQLVSTAGARVGKGLRSSIGGILFLHGVVPNVISLSYHKLELNIS